MGQTKDDGELMLVRLLSRVMGSGCSEGADQPTDDGELMLRSGPYTPHHTSIA